MSPSADERIARLYGLSLEEFTPERNQLAADLRDQGDRETADAVKRLRKPTTAAWALNQLVRAEPDLVEALLGAGGELRQAHRQAASGRGAAQLRAAADAERAAVEQLMTRAPAVLGRAPSAAVAEAMRNTLHAASSDDEARDRVASGTVTHELRPIGMGPVPRAAGRATEPAGGTEPSPRRARAGRSVSESTAAARDEREREAERKRALRAAAASERALQRELEAAQRGRDRAEESYVRAREAAEAAAERIKEARKRVSEARASLGEAQRRRARLERS